VGCRSGEPALESGGDEVVVVEFGVVAGDRVDQFQLAGREPLGGVAANSAQR
jgi:hypothetical protein